MEGDFWGGAMALGVMGLRYMAGGELVAASCCRVVASAPWVAATPPKKKKKY